MKKELLSYMDKHREELFAILSGLIQINTENDGTHGNERPIAEHLQRQLRLYGVESELYCPDDVPGIRQHPDYLPGRNLAGRTNITGRRPGSVGKHALMLAGHMDTVPVGDPGLWTVPPCGGILRDGKIFGRGSCDDKSALAVCLFLAKAFQELGIVLKNDLYLTGYVDEEFGGGNGALACCLKYPFDFCLNLDTENFRIGSAGAGGQRIALTLAHPEPLDSCERMLEGLYRCWQAMKAFGERRQNELSRNRYYSGSDVPGRGLRLMAISSGTKTSDKNKGVLDFAFYTDRSKEQIEKELAEMYADMEAALSPLGLVIEKIEPRSRFFRYVSTAPDNANIEILKKAAEKSVGRQLNCFGEELSDLSLFLSCAPDRAVNFGAGRDFGVYGGAHQPDEFISCDDLLQMAKIVGQFVLDWDERNV